MNNNHFAVCRFLRDEGFDVDLLLYENEIQHFSPVSDSYDLDYMNFTRQLSWGRPINYLLSDPEVIRKDLEPYDVLIGCGWGPAFCEKGGRSLDIMIPYGDDIYGATQYMLKRPYHYPVNYAQRKALGNCKVFQMAPTFQEYEENVVRFMPRAQRWLEPPPMVYSTLYDPETLHTMANRTHWGDFFSELREQNEFLALSHNRHVLNVSTSNPNYKGTDKLLKGWALFRKQQPSLKATLVLLEYGPSVSLSRQMIKELGIEGSVIWMPLMKRKDLMVGMSQMDLVFGQFGPCGAYTCGVVLETLVMGKPLLCARDPLEDEVQAGETYPVISADSSEEISKKLRLYLENKSKENERAQMGRIWYLNKVVQPSLDHYKAYINQKSA